MEQFDANHVSLILIEIAIFKSEQKKFEGDWKDNWG